MERRSAGNSAEMMEPGETLEARGARGRPGDPRRDDFPRLVVCEDSESGASLRGATPEALRRAAPLGATKAATLYARGDSASRDSPTGSIQGTESGFIA